MAQQDRSTGDVDDQRHEAKASHQPGLRHLDDEHPIHGDGKDAQSHKRQKDTLHERCASTGVGAPIHSNQPQAGDCAITQKIEGIGLEGLRTGDVTKHQFNDAHGKVQRRDQPKCAAVNSGRVRWNLRTAATGFFIDHVCFPRPSL